MGLLELHADPAVQLVTVGITVGVTVATGAWIAWMILYPGWMQRPWRKGIFFVGLIAFIAVLTARSP